MTYKQVNGDLVQLSEDEIFELQQQDEIAAKEIQEHLADDVRERRDALLSDCDWVILKLIEQGSGDALQVNISGEWITYRQALRDIPSQDGFPEDVIWPTKP